MELLDFQDYPYSGERRPFDWFMEEPDIPSYASILTAEEADAWGALRVAMLIYLADRKRNYVDYMKRGKLVFLTSTVPQALKEQAPHWSKEVTAWLSIRTSKSQPQLIDWAPAYEIQRLWIITGIHWSWLEIAWQEAEEIIWDSKNTKMKQKLERVSPNV